MTAVIPGRFAARMEEPFAVFIIGMRINKLWAVHKWLPVAKAMPRFGLGAAGDHIKADGAYNKARGRMSA